jgi:hypothetical protein
VLQGCWPSGIELGATGRKWQCDVCVGVGGGGGVGGGVPSQCVQT